MRLEAARACAATQNVRSALVENRPTIAYSGRSYRHVSESGLPTRGVPMRWLLATVVFVLASFTPAWADEALPARPLEVAPATLPPPQPISFDLLDLRAEERAARTPP